MKTWFDEKRMEMLDTASQLVLSPQIQGPLSFIDVSQLLAYLECTNTPQLQKHIDLLGGIGIGTELAHATMSEAVHMFDSTTILRFKVGAEKEHVLSLAEDESSVPIYIGDRLSKIPNKMKKILDYFPDDGDNFVLCTPLMVSVLQSATASIFLPSVVGDFKGPNNTMLTGHVDGVPIYSYLPTNEPDGEDLIILGNYKKGDDAAVTQTFIVKNISFV